MADDKRISELDPADPLNNSDAGEVLQGGTNKQFSFLQVKNFLSSFFQVTSEKNASNGYVGLSGFKIILKNVSGLFASLIQQNNTGNRTYTLQDRDGTLADLQDIDDVIDLINQGNGFVSYYYAVWSGSGLIFDAATSGYYIGGVLYSSILDSITLDPADPTYPRFDVIIADASGLNKITGVASADPAIPAIDPLSELQITVVFIDAGATTPTDVSDEDVYKENVEWVGSSDVVGANFNYATNPFAGTKSVLIPGWTNGKYLRFIKASVFDSADSYYLLFRVKLLSVLNAGGANAGGFILSFKNGATVVSSTVTITSGIYGFSVSNTTGYQLIAVPLSAFTFGSSSFDTLNITLKGISASGAQFDNVIIQGGIPPANEEQNALVTVQTDSGAAVANQANDTFQLNGLEGTLVSASGKTIQIKALPLVVASGTDTYTGTVPTTVALNHVFRVKIPNDNTGASTFNGIPLKKTVTTALAAGDLKTNGVYIFHYDGTNYQVIGLGGSGGGTAATTTFTPAGNIAATDVQAAIQELDTEKLPLSGGSMTGAINEAKGADIASAATTDIGAATGNYVHVTGTTTITALGTIQAGTRRKVKFTGILTLTYHATSLILPTAANITTAADDIAEFISLGSGNWICVGYMRANGTALASTISYTPSSSSVSSGTMTLDANSREVACFEDLSTISSNFIIAFSNTTGNRFIEVDLRITGTIAVTLPSVVVMEEDTYNFVNGTKIITLYGGTASLFTLSFKKNGATLYELRATKKIYTS